MSDKNIFLDLPYRVGTPGYTMPDTTGFVRLPLTHGLIRKNIEVVGKTDAADNWLLLPADHTPPHALRIFVGAHASSNLIVLGQGANVYGEVHIYNDLGQIIIAGSNPQSTALHVRMWSGDQRLFWGRGSTTNGLHIQIQGRMRYVVVGDDCMFSSGIYIRNSDMHAIVDMDTGEQTNNPGDVLIEPHVWVGQDALILKGATLGFGSIIGAKSVVSKPVPRFSLAAGVPATLIRGGVSWDRSDRVSPGLLQKLRSIEATLAD